MVSRAAIQTYANEVGRRFHPRQVILFGSYASGRADEDSDVDLLVIMPANGNHIEKAVEIRSVVPRSFPLDLIVRDWSTVNWRVANNDFFLRDILQNGIVLYEAADARVA